MTYRARCAGKKKRTRKCWLTDELRPVPNSDHYLWASDRTLGSHDRWERQLGYGSAIEPRWRVRRQRRTQ